MVLKWKKRLLLLLLATLCSLQLASQDLAFRNVDWNAIEANVTSIENDLKLLSIENKNLKVQLNSATNQLNEQTLYWAQQQQLLKTCEANLQKSERSTKLWQIGFTVASTVALLSLLTNVLFLVWR